MPSTTVVFFIEDDKSIPSLIWLDDLPVKVQDKFIVRIERLAECGFDLRRPEADFLRDGMYELRARCCRVNYRLLYFFFNQEAVISHGVTKKDKVPDKDINLAIERMNKFAKNPRKYTYSQKYNIWGGNYGTEKRKQRRYSNSS